jgi:hypothetical protein
LPLSAVPATTDRVATALVDFKFKLAPTQYEIRLIIDALPLLKTARLDGIASGGCSIALLLQVAIDSGIYGFNGHEVLHVKIDRRLALPNGF